MHNPAQSQLALIALTSLITFESINWVDPTFVRTEDHGVGHSIWCWFTNGSQNTSPLLIVDDGEMNCFARIMDTDTVWPSFLPQLNHPFTTDPVVIVQNDNKLRLVRDGVGTGLDNRCRVLNPHRGFRFLRMGNDCSRSLGWVTSTVGQIPVVNFSPCE